MQQTKKFKMADAISPYLAVSCGLTCTSVAYMRNIYGSDNGMSHVQRQNIIWTNDRLLLTGPRLNIKTVLSTYGDFHVKDKTAVRTSYL